MGDSLLRDIAKGLSDVVYERDTVCRFGNDEFGVAAEVSRVEDLVSLVEKVQERIASAPSLGNDAQVITANIGISVFPEDGTKAEALITNADLALAQAKLEGRNGCYFFTPGLNEKISDFVSMETELSGAVDRGEFVLHFQPYFGCESRAMTGMEALIRWNRGGMELVSPGEFIPVLEESRLILPVGEWTITEACTQLSAWMRSGHSVSPISVNLSPVQFSQPGLLDSITRIVADFKIESELLVFEITESTFMKDAEYTRELLTELKRRGFSISIDDFGTGHSSLSYLKRFPIDYLKIDQSFVKNLTDDVDDAVLVETIITMAHKLKLRVIAEGVESEAHWKMLKEFGCDMAQGYFGGKPIPASDVVSRLSETHLQAL